MTKSKIAQANPAIPSDNAWDESDFEFWTNMPSSESFLILHLGNDAFEEY